MVATLYVEGYDYIWLRLSMLKFATIYGDYIWSRLSILKVTTIYGDYIWLRLPTYRYHSIIAAIAVFFDSECRE